MAAQYLMPEKHFTFEQLAKIANWRKGYVVWGFSLWKWLMDQGMHMTDYDTIDYQAWADEGVEGLKRSVPKEEFNFYLKNTYDLKAESHLIKLMLEHPNFTYIKRRPTWADVVDEHNKAGICDITLNSRLLNRQTGFSGHRVVLLDINDKEVIFHDPNKDNSGAFRHESLDFFRSVFEAMDEPELARYFL